MEKGEIRFNGPTSELLERPDVLRSVFLEGAAAAVGAEEEGLVGGATPAAVKVKFEPPVDRKGRERAPTLVVRDIAVSFGGIKAVDGVSLDVHEGQIVGLIGPNGAGKTTIFDLISGFLATEGGRIMIGGVDVTRSSPDARARLALGRSFQDARLFPAMTVRQTISVALERHIKARDPLAATLASPATRAAEREVDRRVDHLIELMRLGAFADKFINELSTGSRRIVDLACVLAHEPRILLLDEPSSGIAQRETEALGPLLLDIRDETGTGMIVIEHDMPLITSISDEIVALELGAVIVRGEPDEVINHPRVVASYLGTSEEVINRSGDTKQSTLHLGDGIEAASTDGTTAPHRRTSPLKPARR
jgi:branched-chain amino acid transport system ATP-binding protein